MVKLHQAGQLATLQEHQQALLCLLEEFDRVCKVLQIPYFLFAGTLLGAVRHEGFIPWDDDVDIIMLRGDYDRFLKEAPGVLDREAFFLQKEYSEHFPMFFSKLRLNGTTCLEKFHPRDPQMHRGVYMDIFPCDNAYSNGLGRRLQFLGSKVVIAKGLDAEGYATDSKLKKLVMFCSRILPGRPFRRLVRGPKVTKQYVHCFLGAASGYTKSVFGSGLFENTVQLPFSGGRYPAPKEYGALLQVLYGDYLTLPSEEDRKFKEHAVLVDLTRPDSHYKDVREETLFEVPTKSIR